MAGSSSIAQPPVAEQQAAQQHRERSDRVSEGREQSVRAAELENLLDHLFVFLFDEAHEGPQAGDRLGAPVGAHKRNCAPGEAGRVAPTGLGAKFA